MTQNIPLHAAPDVPEAAVHLQARRNRSELPSPRPAEHTGPARRPYPGTPSVHLPFRGTRNAVTSPSFPQQNPGWQQKGSCGATAAPASLGLSGRRLEHDPRHNTPADNVCPPPLRSHIAAARRDSECRASRYTRLCRKYLCVGSVPQAPSAGPGAGNHQRAKINQRLVQSPSTNYILIWIFLKTQTLKKGRPPVFTAYYVTGQGSITYRALVL